MLISQKSYENLPTMCLLSVSLLVWTHTEWSPLHPDLLVLGCFLSIQPHAICLSTQSTFSLVFLLKLPPPPSWEGHFFPTCSGRSCLILAVLDNPYQADCDKRWHLVLIHRIHSLFPQVLPSSAGSRRHYLSCPCPWSPPPAPCSHTQHVPGLSRILFWCIHGKAAGVRSLRTRQALAASLQTPRVYSGMQQICPVKRLGQQMNRWEVRVVSKLSHKSKSVSSCSFQLTSNASSSKQCSQGT